MNVLYITGLYRKRSCSASIRNVALVNGLKRLGCKVTVLTVKFPEEMLDPYLVSSVLPDIDIMEVDAGFISKYVPSGDSSTIKSKSWIKRVIKNIIYYPGVDKEWIKNIKIMPLNNYNLIISSSDSKTSHFVAKKLKRKSDGNIKWLQIWGDPWADDIGLDNFFLKLRSYYSESKLLKLADYIGYVSLPTANRMISKYPNLKDSIKYIPRSFLNRVESSKVKKEFFHMAYTGVLKGRDIEPVLFAINNYNVENEYKIILNVFGKVTPKQKIILERHEYTNYYGEINIKSVYEVYRDSDALLYLGNSAESTQIPGKLYDYFGTNLPILALVSDVNDAVSVFIKNSNRCVLSENIKERIDIKKFIDVGDDFEVVEEYSSESVASKIIDMMN